MSDVSHLDTTIDEPSLAGNEVELLLFALERSRAQFARKVGGLDAAGLHQAFPPSGMTLGRLIKHLALVEDSCTSTFLTGEPLGPPWNAAEDTSVWAWGWRTADDDAPDGLYALYRATVARSQAAWRHALAAGGLDQPSAYRTVGGGSPNLRRALVDLHDEYARHVGHADLLREAVDGLVGEDPPQPS